MKKLYSFVLLLMLGLCVMAQSPQSFSYQAVVRDGGGQEITGQLVGIQVSLLQTSASGTAGYTDVGTASISGTDNWYPRASNNTHLILFHFSGSGAYYGAGVPGGNNSWGHIARMFIR